jgi:hypothetical protein
MGVQVISYNTFLEFDSKKKVDKILYIVKKGDIAVVEGRLTPEEEMELTQRTMQNVSGNFSGIEIAFLESFETKTVMDKMRKYLAKLLIKNRMGISVIGPSRKIKEIKMDPNKLEIMFK